MTRSKWRWACCTSSAASSGATPSPKVTGAPGRTENGAAPGCLSGLLLRSGCCSQAGPFADKRTVSSPLSLKTSKGALMGRVSEHGIFIYWKINWLKN